MRTNLVLASIANVLTVPSAAFTVIELSEKLVIAPIAPALITGPPLPITTSDGVVLAGEYGCGGVSPPGGIGPPTIVFLEWYSTTPKPTTQRISSATRP